MSNVHIPASKDTLFMRGFSYRQDIENIREFFARECGRNTVEFFKEDGNDQLFVALRFESKDVAKEVLHRFNDTEILGDRVSMTWYKDLRRARPYNDSFRRPAYRSSYGSDQYDYSGSSRDRGGATHYSSSGTRSGYHKSSGVGTGGSSSSRYPLMASRTKKYSRSSSHSRSRSASRSPSASRSRSRSSSKSYRSRDKKKRSDSNTIRAQKISRKKATSAVSREEQRPSPPPLLQSHYQGYESSGSAQSLGSSNMPPPNKKKAFNNAIVSNPNVHEENSNAGVEINSDASPQMHNKAHDNNLNDTPNNSEVTKKQLTISTPTSYHQTKEQTATTNLNKINKKSASLLFEEKKQLQMQLNAIEDHHKNNAGEDDDPEVGTSFVNEKNDFSKGNSGNQVRELPNSGRKSRDDGGLTNSSNGLGIQSKIISRNKDSDEIQKTGSKSGHNPRSHQVGAGDYDPEEDESRNIPPPKKKHKINQQQQIQIQQFNNHHDNSEDEEDNFDYELDEVEATGFNSRSRNAVMEPAYEEVRQSNNVSTANVSNKSRSKNKDKDSNPANHSTGLNNREPLRNVSIGLSQERMLLIKDKKEEIEKAYRQDCETFATVTKLLISKDPQLEDMIQLSLKENLREIGQRCIQELRDFVERIKSEDDI